MCAKTRNFTVLDKLNLERKPVGIKYLPVKPEGLRRIDRCISLCLCVKEAQENVPFYAQQEDFPCVEPMLLGMSEFEPAYISGLAGATVGLFEEARANRRLYQNLPRMLPGSVKYVAFGAINEINFDPDVVVLTAGVDQAMIILRAIGFSSGEGWTAKGTPVIACSWLYIYPALSGEVNFTVTGLSLGMKVLNAFPPGLFLISIPWTRMASILENLEDNRLFQATKSSTCEEHFKGMDALLKQLETKMRE
jgi:uncharacterized protein (DUF169 family)